MKKIEFKTKTPKENFESKAEDVLFFYMEEYAIQINRQMTQNSKTKINLKTEETNKGFEIIFENIILDLANTAENKGFCEKTLNSSLKKASEKYIKKIVQTTSLNFIKEKLADKVLTQNDAFYSFAITKSANFAQNIANKTFEKENKKLRHEKEKDMLEKSEIKEVVVPTPFAPELRGKF